MTPRRSLLLVGLLLIQSCDAADGGNPADCPGATHCPASTDDARPGGQPDRGPGAPGHDATGSTDGQVGGPDSVVGGADHGLDPFAAECQCLSQRPVASYCAKQAVACTVASDCCANIPTIACGTYGNRYQCVGGACKRDGCHGDQECRNYAAGLKLPNAGQYACQPSFCPQQAADYCAAQVQTCNTDGDCCIPGSSVPCGVYPNQYRCQNNRCLFSGCGANGDCVQYAVANNFPDANKYVCKQDACFGSGSCTLRGKPCASASDCCTVNSPIDCNTYGNRFRCEQGECVLDTCTGKQDCVRYAQALSQPDAADYNCVQF